MAERWGPDWRRARARDCLSCVQHDLSVTVLLLCKFTPPPEHTHTKRHRHTWGWGADEATRQTPPDLFLYHCATQHTRTHTYIHHITLALPPTRALQRLNQIHGLYNISNRDFLYVLTTFVVVPVRVIDAFGWRRRVLSIRISSTSIILSSSSNIASSIGGLEAPAKPRRFVA